MTPTEFMEIARRLDVTAESPERQFAHAAIGIGTESGELLDTVKKREYYGVPRDLINVIEEWGDLLWYVAVGLGADGFTFEMAMEANAAKLRARYGETFSREGAVKRDKAAEREAIKKVLLKHNYGGVNDAA